MEILNDAPIILTKDRTFAESVRLPLKPGDVVVLPDDAVLISLPINICISTDELLPEPGLLPGRVEKVVKKVKQEPKQKFAKGGPRRCSSCLEPGHIARHCDRKQPGSEYTESKAPGTIQAATPAHAVGITPEVLNLSPMSSRNFQILKERQEEGISEEDVADEFNHNIDDIRVAFKSKNYVGYTFDRKRYIPEWIRKHRDASAA